MSLMLTETCMMILTLGHFRVTLYLGILNKYSCKNFHIKMRFNYRKMNVLVKHSFYMNAFVRKLSDKRQFGNGLLQPDRLTAPLVRKTTSYRALNANASFIF